MAVIANDPFTRANGPVGANYAIVVNGLTIVANEAVGVLANDFNIVYWSANSFPNDQYAQAKYVNPGGSGAGPATRVSGNSTATMNSYNIVAFGGADRLNKTVLGVETQLGNLSATYVNGDIGKVSSIATTHRVYRNGSLVGTFTDAALSSGSAGIFSFGTDSTFDDFEGGSVETMGAVNPRFPSPSALLFPNQPFGPGNPLREIKYWRASAVSGVNTPISIDVVSPFAAGLSQNAAYQRALSVAAGWAISLARGVQYLRTLSVSGTWTPTLGRVVQYLRTLAVTSTFTPAISRARAVALPVTSTFTANLTKALNWARALAVSSTFAPSLSRVVADLRTLAVASTFTAALSKVRGYSRTLAVATAWATALTKVRGYARSLAAVSTFTLVLTTRFIVGKVLSATSTFTTAIARRFTWSRVLSATSVFTPSVNRSIARRITLAVSGVWNAILTKIKTTFGIEITTFTGQVSAAPRFTGLTLISAQFDGTTDSAPRFRGNADLSQRFHGTPDITPWFDGETEVRPAA